MGLERESIEGSGGPKVSFAEVIGGFASQAGLKYAVKSPDMIVVPFDMNEGRKQNVFVYLLGQDAVKQHIISVFSPALKLAAGQEIGQKTANDLLRRTGRLAHGAWAIITIGSDEYLGSLETLTLETLQHEELKAACCCACSVADELEKSLGVDSF